MYDKSKASATHASNEPVAVVQRRYSHFRKLRKRVSTTPRAPLFHPCGCAPLTVHRHRQLVSLCGKPVEGIDFPKKKFSVKGTSIGKSKGEAERTALFNTWLNAVLLMPDVREHEETKVWLGIEKASKVPAAISLDYFFGSH